MLFFRSEGPLPGSPALSPDAAWFLLPWHPGSLEEAIESRPDRPVGIGILLYMSAEGATPVVPRLRCSFYFILLSRPDGRAYSLPVLRTSTPPVPHSYIKKNSALGGTAALRGKTVRHQASLPRICLWCHLPEIICILPFPAEILKLDPCLVLTRRTAFA